MFLIMNTIFNQFTGGIGDILKTALSWTFTNLGFNTDENASLDKTTATLEPSKLVESYCAEFNGSSSYISTATLDGYVVEGDWSSTIQIVDPVEASGAFSAIFDKNGLQAVPSGEDGFSMYILSGNIEFQIKINGNNAYVVSSVMTYPGLNNIVYGIANNKIFITINGATTIGDTMPIGYQAWRWGNEPMLMGMRVGISFPAAFLAYDVNFPCGSSYPLQGSTYDVSGNANHGTPTDITWGTQDNFHYNVTKGFDKYLDDATSLIYDYVPYASGTPVVASVASYTKQSSHPAGVWHNGAETKFIVGATTYDTGDDAWNVSTLVQTADTEHILHSASTGYGIAIAYGDLVAEQGNYLYYNVQTDYQHKDLLLFAAPLPEGENAVKIHQFVENGQYLSTDVNSEQMYDINNYPIWDKGE